MLSATQLETFSKATGELVRDLLFKSLAPIQERLAALEAREPLVGERGEKGDRGEQGEKGAPGERGDKGEKGDSVSVEELMPLITARIEKDVAAYLATIPSPENGKDGRDGRDGADGESVSIEDVEKQIRSLQSEWALDFERRAQSLLQAAIDRMPAAKDGKDGKDGIGFDDMEVVSDGRRTFSFVFTKGEQRKEFSHKLPVVLDCGVWKDGAFYEHGDGVTYGGSFWIAQKNTDDKPGTNESWRLAVKKGRDAK